MSHDFTIRPLQLKDRPEWSNLWQGYLAFYDTQLSQDVYDTAFARLTGTAYSDFRGLVAERDGELIDLAHYAFQRNLWTVEDICYLGDLYVDPEARGNGVGRALIYAVRDAARAHGITDVSWETQEFNYRGRMLYDQLATRTPFIIYELADTSETNKQEQ